MGLSPNPVLINITNNTMEKLSKSKLFTYFVSAVLILNQAAFLFIPINSTQAQTEDITVTLRKPSDGTTVAGQIPAIVELKSDMPIEEVNFHWFGPDNDMKAMTLQNDTNEYQYDWDTTTVPNGKYTLNASAVYNGQQYDSNQNTVAVENNVVPPQSITVTLMEPADGATVFGQVAAYVLVDTTAIVDKVHLLYFGPSWFLKATNWGEMTPAGNKNEYQYNWDTTVLPDGKYELKVMASIAGQDYYSQLITVAMENNTADVTDPDEINIEFINAPEQISWPVIISAQINMEVDEIFFDIFGPVDAPDPINKEYTAIPESANIYHFKWDINGLPDGNYKVKAFVKKDGLSTYKGTAVNIQRDISVTNGDDMGNISTYLPECGVKEECSADGVCSEKSITYEIRKKCIATAPSLSITASAGTIREAQIFICLNAAPRKNALQAAVVPK